jgi:glycosyltransferase involved in cell wall biosynthesis
MEIGDFKYASMLSKENMISSFRFLLFCVGNAYKLSREGVKIDLVVSYDPLKTGLIGLIVSRILHTKFIARVNGVYTSDAEWVDSPRSLSVKTKKKIYPLIMRFVLKRTDGIKLLFNGQIDVFNSILGGKVIRCFPSYVDVDAFDNLGEDKEVLFVGFPFKRKGADIMIEAFKMVADKYPEWQLIILGWYPDKTELDEAIAGHPQIHHKQAVHHNEMPQQIGNCAILALPSRSEAMGRVLVEAMAAGKPRIGSNIDGIPTVINDGEDGLLVTPEDIEDLAQKLDMLMGDPELRARLGSNAKERANREFSKLNYCANVTRFYNEVIDK